ncbi:MAG: hypothetical protein DI544_05335 [Sphingomonas taxi]|uniref:Putative auto-transporter adhesin head GIN domain-containing protein n=1 Tax=Sphingomonas taxi TaxID=1549858 RepID=A0A2W5PBW3_9SPHN|nr:MAG: hypothetical protein DI544_05335 [Sphingomonas taxi]
MRPLILSVLLLAAPTDAAERRWPIGSVERLRIDAPMAVQVTTGAGTGMRASTPDPAALDALDVRVDGGTLTVRVRSGAPLLGMITIATPRLESVAVFAPAAVSVDAMRGDRVTLSVAGAGSLHVARIEADTLTATLVGEGTITAAGRARDVRLAGNGPGTLDAGDLSADQLTVQAAGDLIVRAAARYAAQVSAGKDAQVRVRGRPRCTVRAPVATAVRCGAS